MPSEAIRHRPKHSLRFAFMSGTSFIIVGFSFVTLNGCEWTPVFSVQNLSVRYLGTAPTTLGLIICGTVLLALGAAYEVGTSREALFPPQLFKDVSCGSVTSPLCQTRHSQITHTVAILIVVFLHSFCFTVGTFYIAIYFQVRLSRMPRRGSANLVG